MKRWLLILCSLGYAALLVARPQEASAAVTEALNLCLTRVIPSLFPFLAVTSLLLRLGMASWLQGIFAPIMRPLTGLPGICAAPLLMGLLGGYPAGARAAAGLHEDGLITRREAELLLSFGNNCGCAFIYSFVGVGMLGSPQAGLWLMGIHALSALLAGAFLCRLEPDRGRASLPCSLPEKPLTLAAALSASVRGAAVSMANICAFVVLFRTLADLLPGDLPAWALGTLELVSGASALEPGPAGFISAAIIIAWGGLCVHCQTLSVIGDLSPRWHWAGKALQALFSLFLAGAASLFLY